MALFPFRASGHLSYQHLLPVALSAPAPARVEGGGILPALPQECDGGSDSQQSQLWEDKTDVAERPRENRAAPLLEEVELTSHLSTFSFTFLLMLFPRNCCTKALFLELCQGMESSLNIKGKNKRD